MKQGVQARAVVVNSSRPTNWSGDPSVVVATIAVDATVVAAVWSAGVGDWVVVRPIVTLNAPSTRSMRANRFVFDMCCLPFCAESMAPARWRAVCGCLLPQTALVRVNPWLFSQEHPQPSSRAGLHRESCDHGLDTKHPRPRGRRDVPSTVEALKSHHRGRPSNQSLSRALATCPAVHGHGAAVRRMTLSM